MVSAGFTRLLRALWHTAAVLALLAIAAAEEPVCTEEVRAIRVAFHLDRALGAFADLDAARFHTARTTAHQSLPCLVDQLSGRTIAELHLVDALDNVLDEEDAQVLQAVGAALDASPGIETPSFLPLGHPVHEALETVKPPTEVDTLPVPADARLLVNGLDRIQRPHGLPVVAQLVGDEGSVLWTTWAGPETALPAYPVATGTTRLDYDEGKRIVVVHRERRPIGLLVATGITAAAAGGLYGGAWASRADYARGSTRTEWEGAKVRTNLLAGTATGALIIAGGLGVATAITW